MGYLFWFSSIAALFCKSCKAFCVPCRVLIPAEVLHSYNLDLLTYLPEFEASLILSSFFLTDLSLIKYATSFQNGFLRNTFALVLLLGSAMIIAFQEQCCSTSGASIAR